MSEECLFPLRLPISEEAKGLGVSAQVLSDLVHERDSLPVEMAIRTSKAYGSSLETLLGMQMAYDFWQAREFAATLLLEGIGSAA